MSTIISSIHYGIWNIYTLPLPFTASLNTVSISEHSCGWHSGTKPLKIGKSFTTIFQMLKFRQSLLLLLMVLGLVVLWGFLSKLFHLAGIFCQPYKLVAVTWLVCYPVLLNGRIPCKAEKTNLTWDLLTTSRDLPLLVTNPHLQTINVNFECCPWHQFMYCWFTGSAQGTQTCLLLLYKAQEEQAKQ